MRIHSRYRGQSGFSLIEVMIAVIVLATGLLALAALQINLTSSSADAKARSRIASLLASTIDDERAGGFAAIGGYTKTCLATGTTLEKEICRTQQDAGVSGLQVTQGITEYYGLGTGAFTTTAPTTPPALSQQIYGDYKQVQISATWNDATGGARSLAATTIASDLGLTTTTTLTVQPLTTTSNMVPVVHETNPGSTAGVIPIAVGNGTNAASTNPRPTLGLTLPSTTFTSLTYTPDSGLPTAIIQKRVETAVAECVCGSANSTFTSDIFLGQNTFRPTYWNGVRYLAPDVPKPAVTPTTAPISQSGFSQDDLCTQCCRDHHDVAADTIKYDSFNSDLNRYKVKVSGSNVVVPVTLATTNGLAATTANPPLVATLGTDKFLDACRLLRVDGLWRVATNAQSEHAGMIATDSVPNTVSPGVPVIPYAKSPNPLYSAEANYQSFVVDYLGNVLPTLLGGGTEAGFRAIAATFFQNDGLVSATGEHYPSAIVDVTTGTTPTDFRFLHVRGLYLDHLEQAAIDKLNSVNSGCPVANYPTCLLPYLPFNTINVTELAAPWAPADATILNVSNGSANLCGNDANGSPIRGCVGGIKAGTSTAAMGMGDANSAIASSLAVNPHELDPANDFTDSEPFTVANGATDSQFFVNLGTYLPQVTDNSTNDDPSVTWQIGAATSFCTSNATKAQTNPSPYNCTTSVLLAVPVTVIVGNYNVVTSPTVSNPCGGGSGTVNQPLLTCSTVTAASFAGPGSYTTAISPATGSKTTAEKTTITITGTPATINKSTDTLNLTFAANGSATATFTCDALNNPTFTTPTSCP